MSVAYWGLLYTVEWPVWRCQNWHEISVVSNLHGVTVGHRTLCYSVLITVINFSLTGLFVQVQQLTFKWPQAPPLPWWNVLGCQKRLLFVLKGNCSFMFSDFFMSHYYILRVFVHLMYSDCNCPCRAFDPVYVSVYSDSNFWTERCCYSFYLQCSHVIKMSW